MNSGEKKHDHEGHRSRFRRRYMEEGLEAFAEHEVLELLLYYCYPRRNTNDIAHAMLKEFGTLPNLFESDVQTIMDRCGVSENIAVLMNLIPSLANRYMRSKWERRIVLGDVKTAGQYVVSLFVGHTKESFYLLSLDTQHRLNHVSLIAEGTLNETAVYPRAIVNEALKHQATAVILTHNHPGGSMKPSRKDAETTRLIVEGLRFLNIEVLDHIVVAGEQYYSFASRGQYVTGF